MKRTMKEYEKTMRKIGVKRTQNMCSNVWRQAEKVTICVWKACGPEEKDRGEAENMKEGETNVSLCLGRIWRQAGNRGAKDKTDRGGQMKITFLCNNEDNLKQENNSWRKTGRKTKQTWRMTYECTLKRMTEKRTKEDVVWIMKKITITWRSKWENMWHGRRQRNGSN